MPWGPTQSPAIASPRTPATSTVGAAAHATGRHPGVITAHHRPGHEAGVDDVVPPVRLRDVEDALELRAVVAGLLVRTQVASDVQHGAAARSDVSDRALDGEVHRHVEAEDVGEARLRQRPEGDVQMGHAHRHAVVGDGSEPATASPCSSPAARRGSLTATTRRRREAVPVGERTP